MGHGKALSAEEKARILELRRDNVSGREIAQRLGRSVNLVATFLRDPTAYGKTIRKPRGNDPELNDDLRRLILAGWASKKTVPQIKASLSVSLSQRAITNFLKSHVETLQYAGETAFATEQRDQESSMSRERPRPTATIPLSRQERDTAYMSEAAPSMSMIAPALSSHEAPSSGHPHNEWPRPSSSSRVQDTSAPAAMSAIPATSHSHESHPRTAAVTSPIPAAVSSYQDHACSEVVELFGRKLNALTELLTSQNAMFSQLVNGQNALIGQLVVVQNTMVQMLQLQQQQQQSRSTVANGNGERRQ